MRIAYWSPLPPERSGIADYSAELLPALARHLEIELVVNDGWRGASPAGLPVHPERAFAGLAAAGRFDAVLYQLGNNRDYHAGLYRALLAVPGVVVLHEYVLHHLVRDLTLYAGDPAAYVAEMRYAYGLTGEALARRAVATGVPLDPWSYPLFERVADRSRALLVHNDFTRRRVLASRPLARLAVVPHHLSLEAGGGPLPAAGAARAALGLPAGAFVVAAFGFVTAAKRPQVLLDAFARLRQRAPRAELLLVGEVSPHYDFAAVGTPERMRGVTVTGRLDLARFLLYMAAADVAVNLRYPTAGETSGTLIRLLGLGKPVVASRIGAFAELPADVLALVDQGEDEVPLLAAYLEKLEADPALAQAMGANASRYIAAHHSLDASAAGYAALLEDVVATGAAPFRALPPLAPYPPEDVAADLLREVSADLCDLGVAEDDDELLTAVAQPLVELTGPGGRGVKRSTWAVLILLALAAAHLWYWYWPRERPAEPAPGAASPGELLAGGDYDVCVWVPFPHQNLGALASVVDLPDVIGAAVRLARGNRAAPASGTANGASGGGPAGAAAGEGVDEGAAAGGGPGGSAGGAGAAGGAEAPGAAGGSAGAAGAGAAAGAEAEEAQELPSFGPFEVPPARELTVCTDLAGGRVRAVARIYPTLAVVARLAGRIAGNPWLAGGQAGRSRIAWNGLLWTVTSGPEQRPGGPAPSGGVPAAVPAGMAASLAVIHWRGARAQIPVGYYSLTHQGGDFALTLAGSPAAAAGPSAPGGPPVTLLVAVGPGWQAGGEPEVAAGSVPRYVPGPPDTGDDLPGDTPAGGLPGGRSARRSRRAAAFDAAPFDSGPPSRPAPRSRSEPPMGSEPSSRFEPPSQFAPRARHAAPASADPAGQPAGPSSRSGAALRSGPALRPAAPAAMALFEAGGSRLSSLGDLPGLAVFNVPGAERWKLPAAGIFRLFTGRLPSSEAAGWRVVALDEASLRQAEALAPRVAALVPPVAGAAAARAPAAGTPGVSAAGAQAGAAGAGEEGAGAAPVGGLALGVWLDPRASLRLVDRIRKFVEDFPFSSRQEVALWRDWKTVLAPLADCERATLTATASPPAMRLLLQSCSSAAR